VTATIREYARRHDLIVQAVDDEVMILDVAAGRVHQLNATASRIWNECEDAGSAEDLARRLVAGFDEVPEMTLVISDVVATLAEFEQLGLVTSGIRMFESRNGGTDDAQR
jgi:hypothetical protein